MKITKCFKNKTGLERQMSRKNLLIKSWLAFMIVTIIFNGCYKDDEDVNKDKTITVLVEGGNSLNSMIDEVKALLYIEGNDVEIAKSGFYNGGFTITLPKMVDTKYLEVITKLFPESLTISNPNALLTSVGLYAYKYGEEVGEFEYMNPDNNYYGVPVYANSNVSITGSLSEVYEEHSYRTTYNLPLKKGWNFIYLIESETQTTYTGTATTSDPGGMKWYFSDWRYDD